MANIQFFALGGIDERDKHLYFFQIDEDIIVFDIGFKLSDYYETLIGIDAIIADQSYLLANQHRIKGIFVSSSAHTKIGGLFVFLQQMTHNIPIYASPFVTFIIKQQLATLHINLTPTFYELTHGSEIIIQQSSGQIKITSLAVFSMTPQTMGFLIEKDAFKIVLLSEFMLDVVVDYPLFTGNYHTLFKLSQQSITHLFLPAGGVNNSLTSLHHYSITPWLQSNFNIDMRYIFIVFHNQLWYLFEIFNYYNKLKKSIKVWIYNHQLWAMIDFFKSMQSFDFKHLMFANWHNKPPNYIINQTAQPEIIILSDQPETIFNFLHDCCTNSSAFTFLPTDEVVLASKLLFGQEWCYELFLEEAMKLDFSLTTCDTDKPFSFLPSLQDIKIILNLINPQYVIPITGFYGDFLLMKSIMPNTTILPNHLLLMDNQTSLHLPLSHDQLPVTKPTFINQPDWLLMHQPYQWYFEQDRIIQDRQNLLSDGFISINFMLAKKTFEVVTNVDIQIQGVVDNGFVIKHKVNAEIKKIIDKLTETVLLPRFQIDPPSADATFIKEMLTKPILDYMFRVAKKTPIVILEVGFY